MIDDIFLKNAEISPEGNLKYKNRPLFITIYESGNSSETIYEKDDKDKKIYNKKMFDGHFYITKKGEVIKGRDCNALGEFAQNDDKTIELNDNNIGICLEGNFSSDILNNIQKQTLVKVVLLIKNVYPDVKKIYFLRDLLDKKSPGNLFPFNEVLSLIDNTLVEEKIYNKKGETFYYFSSRKLMFDGNNIMKGNDVDFLQAILFKLGFLKNVNSKFDSDTLAAVLIFQRKYSLDDDGIIDDDDYEVLNKISLLLSINREKEFKRILFYNKKEIITGDDVNLLQDSLLKQGYDVSVTGFYDKKTEKAVTTFQNEQKIFPADGKVGPITWNTIIFYEPTIKRELYFKMPMMYGKDIEYLQNFLNLKGYSCPVSSYYDNLTERQIKLFQARNGLEVNGKVDANTIKKLF